MVAVGDPKWREVEEEEVEVTPLEWKDPYLMETKGEIRRYIGISSVRECNGTIFLFGN